MCVLRGGRDGGSCAERDGAQRLQVKDVRWSFSHPNWECVSDEAKEVVQAMLTLRERRASAAELLNHPWLLPDDDDGSDTTGSPAQVLHVPTHLRCERGGRKSSSEEPVEDA